MPHLFALMAMTKDDHEEFLRLAKDTKIPKSDFSHCSCLDYSKLTVREAKLYEIYWSPSIDKGARYFLTSWFPKRNKFQRLSRWFSKLFPLWSPLPVIGKGPIGNSRVEILGFTKREFDYDKDCGNCKKPRWRCDV